MTFDQLENSAIYLATIDSTNVANMAVLSRVNLPTVTSADVGKYLEVNASGDWVASRLPSTDEYDVRFTKSGSSWTMNHDYNELVTAARAHKKMTFHIQGQTGCGILEYYDDGQTVEFYGTSVGFGYSNRQFTAYCVNVTSTIKSVKEQVLGNAFEPVVTT